MPLFSKEETKSLVIRPDGKTLSCYSCGLMYEARNPKLKPSGNFRKKIMVVSEAPTLMDDANGVLWSDQDGELLERTLRRFGYDLHEDCISISAVNCVPLVPKKRIARAPVNFEIDCCRKIVMGYVKRYKPSVIIVLGKFALYSIIGNRWNKDFGKFEKWRGWAIPDQDLGCWVCPVYAPNLVRHMDKEEMTRVWEEDIKNALYHSKLEHRKYAEPEIVYLKDDLSVLRSIKNFSTIAFDYEATGLKPHGKEHKIVCASVAVSEDLVYVFPIPKKRRLLLPFTDLLENELIKKMAHNMKYERHWSLHKLGVKVKGWHWDSMLAAHILDNRQEITGLKFQTYVQFGIIDYSSEIEPWLKGMDDKDANSMNRLLEFVQNEDNMMKVLKYCAYDSIYEYRLAMWQQRVIEENSLPF